MGGVWAVIPVKELDRAKQRLAPALAPAQRRALALAMIEDVLAAVAAGPGLAGILVVTVDPVARRLAERHGARVFETGARDGHTGAVAAAARLLADERRAGMLTLPGDVPLVTPDEITRLLTAHGQAPAFTIAPSHDERGSNAVLCSPPDLVPLRFGDDSFLPHLAAAEARGITPRVLRLQGIALDIDNPGDLARFAPLGGHTRTGALLAKSAMLATNIAAPDRARA